MYLCDMDKNILLSELNESQRQAVEYCDGAQLVIAGAGSGKTRVLTYKIAFLLESGLKPWNILALTFTNKAAREMKDRIGKLVGKERAQRLNMGTFHSVFSHILRAEAEKIGFNSNFTIYDASDSASLVKSIIKEMGLDDKVYKGSAVAARISMAKNHLLSPQDYIGSTMMQDDRQMKRDKLQAVYARYVDRCRQANAMDFDDLLVYTWKLFRNHDDIRRKYVQRFHYVLVDEYQDTNFVQQEIVMQLTKEHQHVCVVGDDAQSIYSFRGANIDNILTFNEAYDNARLFKLEQNYRSTQLIVKAANSLISKNKRQIPKDVFSRNEHGERLKLSEAYSDKEEAIIVAKNIEEIRRVEHCEYSDFAILYRTNAQSRTFEEELRKRGMPYKIYGGLSFYQRKEIKDVIAYFRLVANKDDEEAFKRIVNYPTRGIGATTVNKIIEGANRYGVSLWQIIEQPGLFPIGLSKTTYTKIDSFRQMIAGWAERMDTDDAYTLGHDIIISSGISRDLYSGKAPEDISRQQNLEEFLNSLQDFVQTRREESGEEHTYISDFLQEVALLTDLDSDKSEDIPKVTLMTIHSAKGLEFPTVFVVGLEENIFPSPLSTNSMRDLEEERRLLYVAITRAEKHCFLTCAQNRFRYGRMEYDTPSRFIMDIDQTLIERAEHYSLRASRPANRWEQNPRPVATQFRADPKPRIVAPRKEEYSVDPFSDGFKRQLSIANGRQRPTTPTHGEECAINEGATVEHQRFGIGTVVKVEGTGENRKATVEFRNVGMKQLLLKFAKLRIV